MKNVLAFVLGGGRGTRLRPLTKFRSKPAVPLAGQYRLIDIPISNCINSGLKRIYILTQFMSVSLHRHIRQTYRFDRFSAGFVELLAAQQTGSDLTDLKKNWYQGTADAVRKNLQYMLQPDADYVLILSGDQLYRMDYSEMLRTHCESNAEITIAARPVSRAEARGFGVMRTDNEGRVIGFSEKPQTDEEIDAVRTEPTWIDQYVPSQGRDCLGSMGIYLFNRDTLVELLRMNNYEDFGREVFPLSIDSRRVQMHLFDGYWEDIGTIRAFYDANLELTRANAPFDLGQPEAPMFSRPRILPPSQFEGTTVRDSAIAGGCRIGPGCVIENSVIGLRCVIGRNVTIKNSIIMGADEYETNEELATIDQAGLPCIGIGDGAVIDGAIVDKNVRIGKNVRIVNTNNVQEEIVSDDCEIHDGIIVIVKSGTLPDDWSMP